MENKNTIPDNLQYQGKVILKLKKENKTIQTIKTHNNGTDLFFKNILILMLGTPGGSSLMPNFINAGHSTSSTSNLPSEPILKYYPIITSKTLTYDSSNKPQATFTSHIPSTAFNSDNKLNELGLYSNSNEDSLLAKIRLNKDIEVNSGYSLIIEWYITIDNAQTN